MKNKIIAATVLCIASMGAQAEYQVEMNANVGLGERGDSDLNSTLGSMSIYFQAVDTSNGPLQEAAFLSKSSSVNISGFSDRPSESKILNSLDAIATVRYVTSESNSIFEIRGGRSGTSRLGGLEILEGRSESTGIAGIGIGSYLGDSVEIIFNADRYTSANGGQYGVEMHGYQSLANTSGITYDLFFGSTDRSGVNDSSIYYGTGGTYYVNSQLGFSLGVEFESFDEDREIVSAKIGADYFFNKSISASASFSSSDDEAFEDTIDTFTLAGTVRF